jgi:hypothetical protein
MRVDIRSGDAPGTIDVTITGAGLGIPAALLVTPDDKQGPFASRPPGHRFEGYIGDFGAPRELLVVTRDLLAGRIERAAAEEEFARILARWE